VDSGSFHCIGATGPSRECPQYFGRAISNSEAEFALAAGMRRR
jgi:hypothetical protein